MRKHANKIYTKAIVNMKQFIEKKNYQTTIYSGVAYTSRFIGNKEKSILQYFYDSW